MLLAIKWLFIGLSCAGLLYGYFLLFWDDDWDWSPRALLGDLVSLIFFVCMMSIWPFAPRRYKSNWGPISFFAGIAAIGGAIYFIWQWNAAQSVV